jgi:hypothetical protein
MDSHRPFVIVYPLRHVPPGPGSYMSCDAAADGARGGRLTGCVGSAEHAAKPRHSTLMLNRVARDIRRSGKGERHDALNL